MFQYAGCSGLQSRISRDSFCQYNHDCTGMTCCLDLNILIKRQTVRLALAYDECSQTLELSLDSWNKIFFLAQGK